MLILKNRKMLSKAPYIWTLFFLENPQTWPHWPVVLYGDGWLVLIYGCPFRWGMCGLCLACLCSYPIYFAYLIHWFGCSWCFSVWSQSQTSECWHAQGFTACRNSVAPILAQADVSYLISTNAFQESPCRALHPHLLPSLISTEGRLVLLKQVIPTPLKILLEPHISLRGKAQVPTLLQAHRGLASCSLSQPVSFSFPLTHSVPATPASLPFPEHVETRGLGQSCWKLFSWTTAWLIPSLTGLGSNLSFSMRPPHHHHIYYCNLPPFHLLYFSSPLTQLCIFIFCCTHSILTH